MIKDSFMSFRDSFAMIKDLIHGSQRRIHQDRRLIAECELIPACLCTSADDASSIRVQSVNGGGRGLSDRGLNTIISDRSNSDLGLMLVD